MILIQARIRQTGKLIESAAFSEKLIFIKSESAVLYLGIGNSVLKKYTFENSEDCNNIVSDIAKGVKTIIININKRTGRVESYA